MEGTTVMLTSQQAEEARIWLIVSFFSIGVFVTSFSGTLFLINL